MELPDPNNGELAELEEVHSDEKSEDSTNICYQGGKGEGKLLLCQSDAAAAEYYLNLQESLGVLDKDWNVSQLKNYSNHF